MAESHCRQEAYMSRKRKLGRGRRPHQPTKRYRATSAKWIWTTEHQLRRSGLSLVDLKQSEDPAERPPASTWERGSIALDQGSDGVCATNYLLRQVNLALGIVWDLSHGCHRDIIAMLKAVGLWTWAVLMMLSFNVPCGPYTSDQNFKHCKESADALYNVESPKEMPLVRANVSGIIDDLGEPELLASADPDAEVWQRCKDENPWQVRGEKVLMNRFLGFVHKLRSEVKQMSMRALHYQYVTIEEDMLGGSKFEKMTVMQTPTAAEHADGTSMKVVTLDEKALRASCQNSMVIAMVMNSDHANKEKARAVVKVTDAVHKWHAGQSEEVRSPEKALAWTVKQLESAFFFSRRSA